VWQLSAAAAAIASFVPLLFVSPVRRARARDARLLLVGIVGAAAGAALLPVLLRAPAAIATRSLAPLQTGDRMAIGALLGFGMMIALAARCRGLAPMRALDRLAPSMGVLVLLGRVGCFLEGCDFGSVTRAPWAVVYPPGSHAFEHQLAHGLVRATDTGSLPVHPAQLYEALVGAAMVTAALLVLRGHRARARDGDAFRAAMATYAVGRFVVELVRGDDRGALGPLSTPQWMALALLAWAAAGLVAERGSPPLGGPAGLSRNRTRLPN
jgi:phosphatidylglycerol:prolipoprotein diacylglycerol transferase